MTPYSLLKQAQRQRVSDGQHVSILDGCDSADRLLVMVLPQLGKPDIAVLFRLGQRRG